MWQTSGTAMKQSSIKLDNQIAAPTVKDLIIANMIVYNVYCMHHRSLRLTTSFTMMLHVFLFAL